MYSSIIPMMSFQIVNLIAGAQLNTIMGQNQLAGKFQQMEQKKNQ